MPYLDPSALLRRFSRFALEEVRPAIPEDERFVRGQVGSMASTLRFLSGELAAAEDAVERQERALRAALDDVEAVLDERGATATLVREAIGDARAELDADGDAREREVALLEAADDVLDAIETYFRGADARAARRPLYGFLDARIEAQLGMLGRETGEAGDE